MGVVRARWSLGRIVASVVAWLAVGIVMTVLTTWLPVADASRSSQSWGVNAYVILAPEDVRLTEYGMPRMKEHYWHKSTWSDRVDMAVEKEGFWPNGTLVEARRVGVPFRCLGEWGSSPAWPAMRSNVTFRGRWRTGWPAADEMVLPFLPLWPGFALNTLFYAAIAWGLWQLPLALRRRSRAKRGACVRCGYDLKGIAAGSACPECGSVPRGRG